MAVSMSAQEGQFPKVCDLCDSENKINWKCINCNLLMCTRCKDKVHNKIRSSDKHKIIDIKEVGQHSEELDYSNINCEDHEGQTCVLFCKSCDQLVCLQCIAEEHHGHRFVQISEGYEIQIDNVKEIQKQIKSQIEELTNGESKIKSIRKDECSKYTETRNLIQAQNAALKREVDDYTEKLIKELDQKWETLQNSIDEEENKVTAMKTKKKDQGKKLGDIINSYDADQVFKNHKLMEILTRETIEPVKLDFTTMPEFIPGEITEHNIGLLQDVPKVIQQFTTDITQVIYLSSCADNSLWISDHEDVIQRVKPEGSNLKVISNFNMKIYGMAVTPSNDLLLVTEGASKLKQISGSSGQISDSVYSVDPLILTAVHVTRDYKVIVGAVTAAAADDDDGSGGGGDGNDGNDDDDDDDDSGGGGDGDDDHDDNDDDRAIVVWMNKEGKHEKTYEHNRKKQIIFTYVKHITTTTNGTIFVVDELSEYRGRLVVQGQDGNVINTYIGHPKINSEDELFTPL